MGSHEYPGTVADPPDGWTVINPGDRFQILRYIYLINAAAENDSYARVSIRYCQKGINDKTHWFWLKEDESLAIGFHYFFDTNDLAQVTYERWCFSVGFERYSSANDIYDELKATCIHFIKNTEFANGNFCLILDEDAKPVSHSTLDTIMRRVLTDYNIDYENDKTIETWLPPPKGRWPRQLRIYQFPQLP